MITVHLIVNINHDYVHKNNNFTVGFSAQENQRRNFWTTNIIIVHIVSLFFFSSTMYDYHRVGGIVSSRGILLAEETDESEGISSALGRSEIIVCTTAVFGAVSSS
mmetsp:Transcript_19205/g.29115  ORF Transcript_19205/g.29115 Transcript_19205/m.29115 type:complete len:106 (+) Transcript_19205:847-1164(+)